MIRGGGWWGGGGGVGGWGGGGGGGALVPLKGVGYLLGSEDTAHSPS